MAARSFCVSLTAPIPATGIVRLFASVRADVPNASAGLVFVSGGLTQEVARIADHVRTAWKGIPACVVPGAGVLTERGEVEGASAIAGILWSGGRATAIGLESGGRDFAATIGAFASSRPTTAVVFAKGSALTASPIVATMSPSLTLFGAGTVGGGALALTETGAELEGDVAGLVLHGLAPPLIEASAACRLLTAFRTVDEVVDGMLLTIGGEPALDALAGSASPAPDAAGAPAPVVFLALADGEEDDERYVVRPVRGVDPDRRALLVGDQVRPGMKVAFARRDAAVGRAGLEASARSLSQKALGSAPRFAVHLTCAGRGQALYGAADVESRILRQRFGDLPIAGMHGAFEIAPWAPGEARVALYTSVVALFRSPS